MDWRRGSRPRGRRAGSGASPPKPSEREKDAPSRIGVAVVEEIDDVRAMTRARRRVSICTCEPTVRMPLLGNPTALKKCGEFGDVACGRRCRRPRRARGQGRSRGPAAAPRRRLSGGPEGAAAWNTRSTPIDEPQPLPREQLPRLCEHQRGSEQRDPEPPRERQDVRPERAGRARERAHERAPAVVVASNTSHGVTPSPCPSPRTPPNARPCPTPGPRRAAGSSAGEPGADARARCARSGRPRRSTLAHSSSPKSPNSATRRVSAVTGGHCITAGTCRGAYQNARRRPGPAPRARLHAHPNATMQVVLDHASCASAISGASNPCVPSR